MLQDNHSKSTQRKASNGKGAWGRSRCTGHKLPRAATGEVTQDRAHLPATGGDSLGKAGCSLASGLEVLLGLVTQTLRPGLPKGSDSLKERRAQRRPAPQGTLSHSYLTLWGHCEPSPNTSFQRAQGQLCKQASPDSRPACDGSFLRPPLDLTAATFQRHPGTRCVHCQSGQGPGPCELQSMVNHTGAGKSLTA